MDKISSLLEESSESTVDPFVAKNSSEVQAGVVPAIQKSIGLGESTSVSKSSGFYSIQKPKRREHRTVPAKADPKLIRETKKEAPKKRKISGTYSMPKGDKPIRRERVSSKSMEAIFNASTARSLTEPSLADEMDSSPRISGSYQYVKSDARKVRPEEVSLAVDVSAPRPVKGRLKQTFDKILGRSEEEEIEASGNEWYGDKPEGDKYWTVAADDSQRDDHSIWTLLLVFAFLTVLFGVLLWLLLG